MSVEQEEAPSPFFTDLNPTTAPTFVVLALGIVTTADHVMPGHIFGSI
jgi:hypothetical protein